MMGSTDPNAFDPSGPPPSGWTPPAIDHTTGKMITNAPAPAPEGPRPRQLSAEALSDRVPALDRIFREGFSPTLSYDGEVIATMSADRARHLMREVLDDPQWSDPLDEKHERAKRVYTALAIRAAGGHPSSQAPAVPPPGPLSPAEQHAATLSPEHQQWARHWASAADNVTAFAGTHLDAEALGMFDPNAVAVVRVAAARTGAPGDAVAEVLAQVHDFEAGLSRPAQDVRELHDALGRAMGRDGRQVVNQTEDVLERVMRIEPALRPRIPDIIRAIWQVGQRLGWVR